MRTLLIAIVVSLGCSSLAQADPPKRGPRGARPDRAEMHKKILEKFDTNKNGKIDDEEKAAIREAFAKRRAAASGDQAAAKKDDDKKGCPAAKGGCDDKKGCPAGKKGPGCSDGKRDHHHKGHHGHHGRGGHGRGDGDKDHHKDHGKKGHDHD